MTNAPTENLTRADGSPLRVLVVDDEQMLADLLASALRYEGWEVTTAGTGIAAVRSAQEIDPDVIVLDIMLPDFDGLEVMRRVRGHRPNVPVLFLTAKDAVEDRVAGLTAGGDDAPGPARRNRPPSWRSGTCAWTRTPTRSGGARTRSS